MQSGIINYRLLRLSVHIGVVLGWSEIILHAVSSLMPYLLTLLDRNRRLG